MNVNLKLMVSPAPEKFITFIKFINFIIFRSLLHDRGFGPLGTTVTFLFTDIEGSTAL